MRLVHVLPAASLFATTLALAQAPLSSPEGATAARRALGGRVVDCAEHGVWTPPPGWAATSSSAMVLALAPDGSAAIARVRARPRLRDDARFLAQAEAALTTVAGSAPTLGALVAVDHGRWRRERTVEGTVVRGGVTLRVWAHAERSASLWIGAHRDGDTVARAAIDAAVASYATLVDHACLCGYDCDHR